MRDSNAALDAPNEGAERDEGIPEDLSEEPSGQGPLPSFPRKALQATPKSQLAPMNFP